LETIFLLIFLLASLLGVVLVMALISDYILTRRKLRKPSRFYEDL